MNKKTLLLSLSLCLSLVSMPSFAANDASMLKNVGVEVVPVSMTEIDAANIEDALISFHTADSRFGNTVTLAQADAFIPRFTFTQTGISDADDMELKADPLADGIDMSDDEVLLKNNIDPGKVSVSVTMPSDKVSFTTAMNTYNRNFYNQLINTGYLNEGTTGTFAIDTERLANNIRWRVWADNGIEDLREASLDYRTQDLNTVEAQRLSRVGDAALKTVAGVINTVGDAIDSVDGDDNDIPRFYIANYDGKEMKGDVLLTNQKLGDMGSETDLVLKSHGSDLNGKAHRVIDQQADGTLKLSTIVNHDLGWGAKAEILEERFINSMGQGVGHGVVVLTDSKGKTTELPLRTMTLSDGRLVTQIGDNTATWLMNEDASGNPVMLGVDKVEKMKD